MKKTLILSLIFVAIDQVSKYFAISYLKNPVTLIQNFFTLTYAENTGIAFSIAITLLIFIIKLSNRSQFATSS